MMAVAKIAAAIAAGVALLTAGAASAAPAAPDFRPLRAYLQGLVDSKHFPGASVLVVRDGKEIYFGASGFADVESATPIRRDTIFRIYSMSKPVTTAAVMILVDEGRVRLDDPVAKYVPEFANLRVFKAMKGDEVETEPARDITVADLLTHTSGLTYPFQMNTPVAALYRKTPLAADAWRFDPAFEGGGALARTLADLPLVYQPGTRFHYSMSLDVAALVVQRASGQPFGDFLQQRIFGPLGMRDTGFWVAPEKGPRLASLYGPGPDGLTLSEAGATSRLLKPISGFSGGGGLLSTVDDYARFARMLDGGGALEGHRLLSRASAKAMMTNHLTPEQLVELPQMAAFGLGGKGEGLGFGYGGSVVLDTKPLGGVGSVGEYAWGGAASTTFWVDPVRHIVVVFMTQLLPPGAERTRDHLRELTYKALDGAR